MFQPFDFDMTFASEVSRAAMFVAHYSFISPVFVATPHCASPERDKQRTQNTIRDLCVIALKLAMCSKQKSFLNTGSWRVISACSNRFVPYH